MSNQQPPVDWRYIFLLFFLFLFIIFGLSSFDVYAYDDYEDDYEYEGTTKVEKKYFSFGNSGGIDLDLPIISLWSTSDVYLPSINQRRSFINTYNNQILYNYNTNTQISSIPTDHLLEPFHYVVTYGYVSDYIGSNGVSLNYYDSEGKEYSLESTYENKVYMLCIYGIVNEAERPFFLSSHYVGNPTTPNYLAAQTTESYDSKLLHYYFTNKGGYSIYFNTSYSDSLPATAIFYEFYMSVDGRNWYIPSISYPTTGGTAGYLLSGFQYTAGASNYYGPIYCGWEEYSSSNDIRLTTKFYPPVVYSDFDLIATSSHDSSKVSSIYEPYDYRIGGSYVYKIVSATPLPERNLSGDTTGSGSTDSGSTDSGSTDSGTTDDGTTGDTPIDDNTDESIFKRALRAVFGNFLDTAEALFESCTSIFDLIKTLWDLVVYRFTEGDLEFALPYYFFTLARVGVTVLVILIVIKFIK